MAPPFRSLVFLGIWKVGLWPGRRDPLTVRTSTCTFRRRSVPSCSGITPSPHPGWSPFWLAVAEVAVEFFGGSPPSGWRLSVSVHSECFFPTALGFWAIFGHRARSTGNVAGTITAPLHTLSTPHPASAIVKMTYAFFSSTANRCRHYVYIQENPRRLTAACGIAHVRTPFAVKLVEVITTTKAGACVTAVGVWLSAKPIKGFSWHVQKLLMMGHGRDDYIYVAQNNQAVLVLQVKHLLECIEWSVFHTCKLLSKDESNRWQ